MDWKTYEGEEKHYDIHTSTFEGALLPLVDGIWELSLINGFMSLSINETLIIDNLDVEPYPISPTLVPRALHHFKVPNTKPLVLSRINFNRLFYRATP